MKAWEWGEDAVEIEQSLPQQRLVGLLDPTTCPGNTASTFRTNLSPTLEYKATRLDLHCVRIRRDGVGC